MNDNSDDNRIDGALSNTDKADDDLNSKDMKQLYSYTDSQNSSSNNQMNKYNYGNSYNYNSGKNFNYNTYGFSSNQNNNSYLKEGNKLDKRFILILSSCALLACIFISIMGVGLYNFIKNAGQNDVGLNNNNINNKTFNNSELVDLSKVNYDNFTKITSSSSLNDVKDLLKVNPTSRRIQDSKTLTQYNFAEIISVTFDDDGTIIDKIIDSSFIDFPNSVSDVSFSEFQKLKSKMPLGDIEDIFVSKGVLTESTYKSVEGYFFAGDSYTWPTDKTSIRNSYIICDFDSDNNLVRAINYDHKMLPESSEVNIDKDIIDKFEATHLDMSYEEVESNFDFKLILEDIGSQDIYTSSYYYDFNNGTVVFIFDEDNKVFIKWISSGNYDFYDANAQDSSKINELKQGMSYTEIKDILGYDGYLCYEYSNISKSYIWVFDDDSRILVYFNFSTPDGKAIQIEGF